MAGASISVGENEIRETKGEDYGDLLSRCGASLSNLWIFHGPGPDGRENRHQDGQGGIIIRFIYTDPDSEYHHRPEEPAERPGYYGSYRLGPCELQEDVWSKQAADFSHSFWHGMENPVAAVTRGKVKQGGKITAMLKLLPVVKPAFQLSR